MGRVGSCLGETPHLVLIAHILPVLRVQVLDAGVVGYLVGHGPGCQVLEGNARCDGGVYVELKDLTNCQDLQEGCKVKDWKFTDSEW